MSKTKNENKVRKGDYGYLVCRKKEAGSLLLQFYLQYRLDIFFSATDLF